MTKTMMDALLATLEEIKNSLDYEAREAVALHLDRLIHHPRAQESQGFE